MSRTISIRMPLRQIRARWRQMLPSVIAIALGVALVVGIQLMNAAVLQSFVATTDGIAGRASFSVSPAAGSSLAEATAEEVRAVAGVKLAVPLVRAVTFADDGSGDLLTVHGVDLANEAAVRLYSTRRGAQLVDDWTEFLNKPAAILLGREYADSKGLGIGNSIALVTPVGVQTFEIMGLIDAEGLAEVLRGRLVVMDLFAAARRFLSDGQISQIDIVVDADSDIELVKQRVRDILPADLVVEEPVLQKRVLRQTVDGFQRMVTSLGLLAVLAGFVISYSRLSAVYAARVWQIGVLRAIGVSRRQVFGELLKESLLLGALATLFGLALGQLIARVGLPTLAQTTAIAFRMPVAATITPMITWSALLAGALVGLLASVCAAFLPVWRATQVDAVAALRQRERESAPHSGLVRRLILLAAVVLAALLALLAQRWTGEIAAGHFATVAIAVAALFAAVPLVALGGRLAVRPWRALFGPVGAFAVRQLQRRPQRSSLTVATLGIGIGSVLLFTSLGVSFERTLVGKLSAAFRADFILESKLALAGYRTAPFSTAALEEARQVNGVAEAAAVNEQDLTFRGTPIIVYGYDAAALRDRRLIDWELESEAQPQALENAARGEVVLVSRTLARAQNIRVGETIDLPAAQTTLQLPVGGIVVTQLDAAIVMSRDAFARGWPVPHVQRIWIRAATGSDLASVATELRRVLGRKYQLSVRSGAEFVAFFAAQVQQAFRLFYILEAITLILILFALGDTLATAVLERIRHFGLMRSCGFDRRGVFAMVLIEGATIGVFGLLLASLTGGVLGVFWIVVQFPAILGWRIDVHLPYRFAMITAATTIGLCLLASFLPSRRAARVSIVDALRGE